ncbi:VWA domain-containing protein [Candidatus Poribacteria bacterium]|nr:VWA domain-containing protein [Candidatus Poribacteria bacterium]
MMLRNENQKTSNAFLISLSIHIAVAILVMAYPISKHIQETGSSLSVDWVENVPEPQLQRETPKKPIEQKFDPNRDFDTSGKKKTNRASPSKKIWVKKLSDRVIEKSVEMNDGPKRDQIPDVMTSAEINSNDSPLSSLVSTEAGPIDGRGILGDRVRAKGNGDGTRSGASILGLGGAGEGFGTGTGGGTGGGILDPLGIIKFMDEGDGPQKIVYLLDVSASMSMGSKLPVSVKSLKESMLQLGDFDEFNIVTFHSQVQSFRKKAVPASMKNIEKASRYLDSFTAKSIENNLGTDILTALRYSLSMEPAVIVLITDIQPTRGEVDENKIAEEVKRINKTNTRIYGIGVEVWEPKPDGRLAKLLKVITEQNGGQMRLASSG